MKLVSLLKASHILAKLATTEVKVIDDITHFTIHVWQREWRKTTFPTPWASRIQMQPDWFQNLYPRLLP